MKNRIKYLVMDVDGTLTDGKVYIGENGEVFKAFNIKDGCGIHDVLPLKAIKPIIITGRNSKIVEIRAKELGVREIYQGVQNKLDKLKEIIPYDFLVYTAYIGDDINDLPCIEYIKKAGGVIGCPADAFERVKEFADFISQHKGGCGAVRDFIEWI